jgi:hypothetical protein
VRDGDYSVTHNVLSEFTDIVDYVLMNRENSGLGPSINMALAHIDALNRYNSDPVCPDQNRVTEFVCYNQDDLLYSPRWLEKITSLFLALEKQHKIGFASGVECFEHPVKKRLNSEIILKDYIRAAQMFARREYWMSMFPVTRYDPETRNVRAKPNDGIGSGVDWHFIRNHPNSVCRTGKTCLVIPGLVKHLGYRDSTWLARELPESVEDKLVIEGELSK